MVSQGSPHPALVHLALVATQLSFGGASIVGKFGVHGTNPALFALIREGCAGPILCALAFWQTRRWLPKAADVPRVLQAGFCVFANQFFYIVGLKLSDPTTASAWQPIQPIMTLALAVLLRFEKLSCRKAAGILIAVFGAIVLVAGDAKSAGPADNPLYMQLVGHAFFFLNDLGTSCYVLRTKALFSVYESISVAGWSYMSASVMMLIAVTCINSIPAALHFVCSDKQPSVEMTCVDGAWRVPTSMVAPLVYWIMMSSVLAYFCMTWANQYAKPSAVSAYTCLQPVAAVLLSCLLVLMGGHAWASRYGIELPGWSDLGIIGIFAGLACLFSEPSMENSARPDSSKVAMLREQATAQGSEFAGLGISGDGTSSAA